MTGYYTGQTFYNGCQEVKEEDTISPWDMSVIWWRNLPLTKEKRKGTKYIRSFLQITCYYEKIVDIEQHSILLWNLVSFRVLEALSEKFSSFLEKHWISPRSVC